jgi:hypothetical protein
MKTIGGFVFFVILSLLIRDGLGSTTVAEPKTSAVAISQSEPQKAVDPFETTAKVSDSCDMVQTSSNESTAILGQYNSKTHEIKLCDRLIALAAQEFGTSATALKRYLLAHEAAHSRGEMDEFKADKIAVDRLVVAGDLEALKAYASIPEQGSAYDAGRRYARQILKSLNQ